MIAVGVGCVTLLLLHACASDVRHGGQPVSIHDALIADQIAAARSAEHAASTPPAIGTVDDTLWIIAREHDRGAPAATHHEPTGLFALAPEGQTLQSLPLKHTHVEAKVQSFIASVQVQQHYENPFHTKIEAIYRFPLPGSAAVDRFVMRIGERRIYGVVKEREAAERYYEQAKRAGHNAALLHQNRANLFEQRVANIEPGRPIDIKIRYFNTLRYVDDGFVFHLPTTAGPRFVPAGHTFENPAYRTAAGGNHHRMRFRMVADLGIPIQSIQSPTHALRTRWEGDIVEVTLADQTTGMDHTFRPDRDIVIKLHPDGGSVHSAIKRYTDPKTQETYFAAMLTPPAPAPGSVAPGKAPGRRPGSAGSSIEAILPGAGVAMEWVFLLDASGSMKGRPLQQAKDAIRYVVNRLDQDDRFQIYYFSNQTHAVWPEPAVGTWHNQREAERALAQIRAGGGTDMLTAFRATMRAPIDPKRQRVVCLMTDGQISDEQALFEAARSASEHTKVFGFGIGSSPNRHLLEGLARAVGGVQPS